MKVFLDFETRSRCDLRAHGVSVYAQDPSTEVLCMAYAVDDGPVELWTREDEFPWDLLDAADEIHSHNASFERYIFRYVLKKDYPISKYRCTAAKAAYASLPRSLARACDALELGDQGKDKEGHALMMLTCKPDKKGNWVDDDDTLARLYSYCIRDVAAERLLDSLLPDPPDWWYGVWEQDRIMNERGVPIDRELCEAAVDIFGEYSKRSQAAVFELSNGEINTGNQRQKILDYVNERGLNIDDLQRETVERSLQTKLDPDVRSMLELRQSVSGSAATKYKTILARADTDDRLREAYMFPGTHTGRRSAPGVQLQNMKKGRLVYEKAVLSGELESSLEAVKLRDTNFLDQMFDQSPISMLGEVVRGAVCASPGNVFVLADFSQIEVRIAHWLAGNTRMLKLFAEGADPYIDFASGFFETQEVTGEQRTYAKPIIIGGNYGMGPKRLIGYAENYGVALTIEEAKETTEFYRKRNKLIVQCWSVLDEAVLRCMQTKLATRVSKLGFRMEGRWFSMLLPSGRKLYYFGPKLIEGKYGPVFSYINTSGTRETLWGGTWMENACQAITADLENPALIRAEAAGLCPVLDQHDEIGIEVAEETSEESSQQLVDIMCQRPSWADGLPIGADARIRKRFTK